MVFGMQQEPPAEAEVEEQVSAGMEETGEENVPVEDSAAEGAVEVVEEEAADPTPEEESAKWKELAMRATADLENYRKRMTREKAESLRYGNQALLETLLPVLDNFEMGLQAAAQDQESMIYRGMEMVKKQLDDFLSGQGVEEIPAEGQAFDPNVHEAVSQEECAESEEGMVLRVIRRGYKMHDRLLRPANVIVSKAPEPETSSEPEGE